MFLTNQFIYFKDLLAGGDLTVKSDIIDAEAALQSLFHTELEGHKIRSAVKWLEEVEAPSAFFLKVRKSKATKTFHFLSLEFRRKRGFSLPDLMSAHKDFYSALFGEEPIEVEVQNLLSSHVSRTLSENCGLICKVFVARGTNASPSTCK